MVIRHATWFVWLVWFLLKVLQTEEAFFTETLLWHTITIDEGHRCSFSREAKHTISKE